MKKTATSFQRSRARTAALSVPDPEACTADPHLHRRLRDTQRQVCISLLWGHCSFLLGPVVHEVSFEPSKYLWQVRGLILKFCPSYHLAGASPLVRQIRFLKFE